jgi:hypothetical protein
MDKLRGAVRIATWTLSLSSMLAPIVAAWLVLMYSTDCRVRMDIPILTCQPRGR